MDLMKLKARKQELGLTNEDLAELSGIPISTVQKVMAGITKTPRTDTAEALEAVLLDENVTGYIKKIGKKYKR